MAFELMNKEHPVPPGSLAELIREDRGSVWVLQEIQNTLSLAEDVPLRLVKGKTVCSFLNNAPELKEDLETFKQFIDEGLVSDLERGVGMMKDGSNYARLSSFLNNNLWITEGSYSNPVMTQFREDIHWRRWETIWVLATAVTVYEQVKKGEVEPAFFEGFIKKHLMTQIAYIEELDALIFVGPVWRWIPPGEIAGRSGQELTNEVTDGFVEMIGSRLKHLGESLHNDRLRRLGGARSAITLLHLESQLKKTVRPFRLAMCVGIKEEPGHEASLYEKEKLGANHWVGVAQLCVILFAEGLAKDLKRLGEFLFRPPTQKHELSEPVGQDIILRARKLNKGRVDWELKFVRNVGDRRPLEGLTGRIVSQTTEETVRKSLVSVDVYLNGVIDKIHTSRNYFFQERIRLVQFRLEDSLVHLKDNEDQDASNTDKGNGSQKARDDSPLKLTIPIEVLQSICYTLNVDVCTAYHYSYEIGRLEMIRTYYRDQKQKKKWGKETGKLIWRAGAEGKLRCKSICYRAFERGGRIVAPALEPGQLLLPDGDNSAQGATLAVPIQIFQRPWGILHLRAAKKYQIRESTPRWAHEFARAIGNTLFSQWIKMQLHGLNQAVMQALHHENPDVSVAYLGLCRHLQAIFMVEKTSLWVAENSTGPAERFNCVMSFGHRAGEKPEEKKRFFRIDDEDAIGAGLVKNDSKVYLTGDLQDICDDLQKDKTYKASLFKNGGRDYCVFKFLGTNGRCNGVLWLVSRECYRFDQRWESLLAFFSRHIGLLLDLIHSREKYISGKLIETAHEIGGKAQSLINSVEDLEKRLAPMFDSEDGVAHLVPEFVSGVRLITQKHGISLTQVSRDSHRAFNAIEGLFYPARKLQPGTKSEFNVPELLDRLHKTSLVFESGMQSLIDGKEVEVKYHGEPTDIANSYRITMGRDTDRYANKIEYHGSVYGPFVPIPFEYISTILRNQIVNALKYNIGHRPVQVNIKEMVGEYIILRFTNIGWSMPDEEQQQLKGYGFRTRRALDYWPDQGKGLGLAVSTREVEKWGGELNIELKPVKINEINLKHHSITTYQIEKGVIVEDSDFCRFIVEVKLPSIRVE